MSNITQFSDIITRTCYSLTSVGTPVFDSQFFIPNNGGNLICKSGGVAMIVATSSSQVGRTWYTRSDAIASAVTATKHYGWFIPSIAQLQNPGYCCRAFWDAFTPGQYWSNSDYAPYQQGCCLDFGNASTGTSSKTNTLCVRAFRCVTY